MGKKISIIGSGTVGYAIGRGFNKRGHSVLFCDIDKNRVNEIRSDGYNATSKIEKLTNTNITFVTVPTPTKNGKQNLSYLEKAIKDFSGAINKKEGYHLLTIKSTVLPGTTKNKVIPFLEKNSDKKVGKELGVAMNPEFLTEASPLEDFLNQHRVVIGEYDKKSGDVLEELYQSFDAPIYRTSLKEAEMTKYVANNFLSTKISYFNLIYLICEELNIDGKKISKIVGEDPRIGKYGTLAGKAFGGHCLPKDLRAFNSFLEKESSENKDLFEIVENINKKMEKEYGVYKKSGISNKD